MTKLYLHRTRLGPSQTEGVLYAVDQDGNYLQKFYTVELPWKDNAPRVSCIPPGVYMAFKRQSPSNGPVIELRHVPGRSLIQIHSANYVHQLLGCIAPGLTRADLNRDGLIDVLQSRDAIAALYEHLGFADGTQTETSIAIQ